MRADLMNCDINYEDPPEKTETEAIAAPRTVTWKCIVTSPFKTPQECVGQGRHPMKSRPTDRHPWGARSGTLGVTRLKAATWNVGTSKREEPRQ